MQGLSILIIPDPQIKEESCLDHLRAAGNYAVKTKPDVIVAIGDWADMPSLSKHASAIEIEGRRIAKDIEAGKKGMREFLKPIQTYNNIQRRYRKKLYEPRMVFTIGNHCSRTRLSRLVTEMPILQDFLKDDFESFLKTLGWEVYDFLEIVNIGGIKFSHYFINPHSAKKSPAGGTIDNMLKSVGFSFVQGHTQGLKMGKHYLADGTARLGIVAGSFYMEDENYMGLQGNKSHWRGIVRLDDVKNGNGDISEISLDRLLRDYG